MLQALSSMVRLTSHTELDCNLTPRNSTEYDVESENQLKEYIRLTVPAKNEHIKSQLMMKQTAHWMMFLKASKGFR